MSASVIQNISDISRFQKIATFCCRSCSWQSAVVDRNAAIGTSVDGFDDIKVYFSEELGRVVFIWIWSILRFDIVQLRTVVKVLETRLKAAKISSTYAIAGIFERQNIRKKLVHFSFEIEPSLFFIPFFFQI